MPQPTHAAVKTRAPHLRGRASPLILTLLEIVIQGKFGPSSDRCYMTQVPTFDEMMLPLFNALKELGGSASIAEIDEKVGEILALPEEVLEHPHNPEKSNQTEFQYRLAWARTYLKQYGLIDNSSRLSALLSHNILELAGKPFQYVVLAMLSPGVFTWPLIQRSFLGNR